MFQWSIYLKNLYMIKFYWNTSENFEIFYINIQRHKLNEEMKFNISEPAAPKSVWQKWTLQVEYVLCFCQHISSCLSHTAHLNSSLGINLMFNVLFSDTKLEKCRLCQSCRAQFWLSKQMVDDLHWWHFMNWVWSRCVISCSMIHIPHSISSFKKSQFWIMDPNLSFITFL